MTNDELREEIRGRLARGERIPERPEPEEAGDAPDMEDPTTRMLAEEINSSAQWASRMFDRVFKQISLLSVVQLIEAILLAVLLLWG